MNVEKVSLKTHKNLLEPVILKKLLSVRKMVQVTNIKLVVILKQEKFLILLVPLTTIAGTLLGVGIVSFFLPEIDLRESLAVGAGFGYYSLSSIIITQIVSPALGVIALLSNITREIITLLFIPIMAKYLGKLAPVTSGGATSMDTTLPIITRYCGKQYAIISVFHGTILTILVPVIVTFILKV